MTYLLMIKILILKSIFVKFIKTKLIYMNYTLYILIGLLFISIFFIPNKKTRKYEKFNNNKFSLKNSLKTIPSIIPHLII